MVRELAEEEKTWDGGSEYDYSEYGGAPLLGVDGTCIICHGSSNARAIKNAILRARDQLEFDINHKIAEQLQKVPIGKD